MAPQKKIINNPKQNIPLNNKSSEKFYLTPWPLDKKRLVIVVCDISLSRPVLFSIPYRRDSLKSVYGKVPSINRKSIQRNFIILVVITEHVTSNHRKVKTAKAY